MARNTKPTAGAPRRNSKATAGDAGGAAGALVPALPAHCACGPSSAHRWLQCPASVTLARGRSNPPTFYTAEGTAAHEVAQRILEGKDVPETIEVDGHEIEITDDMLEHVQLYVQLVDLYRGTADWCGVERRVYPGWILPDNIKEPLYGTADFVCFELKKKRITVIDLKYGQGVFVETGNDIYDANEQLLLYALGAINELPKQMVPHTIQIMIVQPRAGGEPVRKIDIDIDDLYRWASDVLLPAMFAIDEGSTAEVPGDHCRFCVRAGECNAFSRQALAAAQHAFDDDEGDQALEDKAHTLSSERLAEIMDKAEIVEHWIAAVRTEIEQRLDKGEIVPGWKLVQKRGIRKWIDDEVVDALSARGLRNSDIYEAPKPRSPAQLEKVCKKLGINFDKVAGDLVTKVSSGTTLARASDRREEVKSIPAAQAFDDGEFEQAD